MDVKPGYKRTEIGVIPEDWDAVPLDKLGMFKNGINKSAEAFGHGFPFVNLMDVFGLSSISSTSSLGLIDTSNLEQQTYDLCKGDVLFVRSSVKPSGVGLTAVVEEDLAKTVFSGFLIRFRDNGTLDSGFKRHCFLEEGFRKRLISASSVSANTNISQDSLKRLFLGVPPTRTEQHAIAEALSDVDALISALDRLIAKKRAIKQGAMQELLRPKDRWVEKRLGETAILKARIGWQGLTTAEYLDSGDYYLVTGTEFKGGYIDWQNCHYVSAARYGQDRNIQLREHDVLVTKDGTIGKVALITHLDKPATLNSGVFVIRPIGEAFDPEFFYYMLCSKVFTDFLTQLSAGSTINHLYQKDFVSFVYKTPETLPEQTAIAIILSDMDAEIAALERRRDKTKLLKQGMMQELLTGRTRLV